MVPVHQANRSSGSSLVSVGIMVFGYAVFMRHVDARGAWDRPPAS